MDLCALRPALLLLLCFCGLSLSNVKVLPPGPLDAMVGSEATFRTLLDNPEFMVITWSFYDGTELHSIATLATTFQKVQDEYTGRANVDANGTLTLKALTEKDSGDYNINIIDAKGDTEVDDIKLRVMVPVSDVVITSNIPEARELFSTVVLTCTAKGNFLNFQWFNVSTPITEEGTRVTINHAEDQSTLSFSSVYRADLVGPLFCEASNTLSKNKSDAFSLRVHYGPERVTISPEAPPAFLASHMNFSLTCSSVSSPEATYAWFFEGKPIQGATTAVLTLQEILKAGLGKRPGNYVCNATNAKTEKSVASPPVSFSVMDAISGVKMSSPVGKLVAGNSSANLSCSAGAGTLPIVHWLKNRAELSSGGRVVISPDRKTLLIQPVQKEDNAEFTCQFSNPVSNEQDKAKLIVYYGPEPVVLTGDTEVEVNDPVKLDCSAPSLPPANYTWKFNGTLTAVTTNHYVIDKAVYGNTGTYTCEAHNAETGGTSSKSISVSVKEEGTLDEGLSDGAIAGIVIGVLAAIGLAIGLFLYCRQKVPVESPY